MPATYEPIATTTLGSAVNDITFTSIGSGYTDLRLVVVGTVSSADTARIQFNGDTATNYSRTTLYGDGASAVSARSSNGTFIGITTTNLSTTIPGMLTIDLFSYAGSTNKTILTTTSLDLNGSGRVERIVGLWRSTAAITSIKCYLGTNNWNIGTTATLYGILKA
jgi:hypothetical protein